MAGEDLLSNYGPMFPVGDTQTYQPYDWGQQGRTMHVDPNGQAQYLPGTTGADADVSRYRNMGATRYTPTSIDTGQSDASRGLQLYGLGQTSNAMNLQRSAALGQQPSAAEIYGGKLLDDSINSQMGMAASARGGPGAVAAAQRQAAFTGAQTQQSGARDLAAMRANEMAGARDAYANTANAYGAQSGMMRGQDQQGAQAQAALTDANAAREQQNQQFYEQLGWNTRKQQQDAAMQDYANQQNAAANNRQMDQQGDRDAWGKVKDVVGGIAGLAGGIFSDVRAKADVYPLGPTGAGGIIHQNPFGEPAGGIIRDNPYGPGPAAGPERSGGVALLQGLGSAGAGFAGRPWTGGSGGISPIANAPYAPRMMGSDRQMKYVVSDVGAKLFGEPTYGAGGPGGGMMLSDARAKQAAWEEGRNYGRVEGQRPGAAQYVNMAGAQGERPGQARVIGASEPEEPLPDGVAPSPHPLPAPPSPRELSARAWEAEKQRLSGEDPMASANRAQQGSAYTYKPEFAAQSGQAPGEVNVGPMAQTMAQNPVARTAVKQDPGTGLYVLDSDKLSKLHSAGIGSLQSQVDAIKNRLSSLVGRR